MDSPSKKKFYSCECISSTLLSGDTSSLEFVWPGPAPMAGQFFFIKPKWSGVFLGRPISVAGWKPNRQTVFQGNADRRSSKDRRDRGGKHKKEDAVFSTDRRAGSGGVLRFIITRIGQGSRELTAIRPGEEAGLSGPLGNSWNPDQIPLEISKGKIQGAFALVGGGAGIAPLLALSQELRKKTFDFYAGFRAGAFGLENLQSKALIIATEDGSQGVMGLISDYFSPMGYNAVFACGPDPMLEAIAKSCASKGVPCYISTGKHMACGVGACLGCKIKTTRGELLCCADGPIFRAEEIIFEG